MCDKSLFFLWASRKPLSIVPKAFLLFPISLPTVVKPMVPTSTISTSMIIIALSRGFFALIFINRVATCQGKVREKQNFLQVRELSGNFEKMSGNFVHLTNVRELSGNFVMTINFFLKMISLLLLGHFFKS